MMLKRLALILMAILMTQTVIGGYVQAQTVDYPSLTEPGSYGVRIQKLTFVDQSRGDWKLDTYVWYPADKTKGKPAIAGSPLMKDSPPDLSGAPYPLVIYSHGHTGTFGEVTDFKIHLASQGYVVVAPQYHDTDPSKHEFVDRPLDLQLVLRELAAIKEGDLSGMIDMENIGLIGYSQGAVVSLQMLGLVNDPASYTAWCKAHPEMNTLDCAFIRLAETEAYRKQLGLTTLPDGRWTPFSDKRIRAVLTIAPCGFPLTTEDSLASVTTPILIIHGTQDLSCDYQNDAVRLYNHLASDDRYLITVVMGMHEIGYDAKYAMHFGSAFFGYYLKGDKAYQPYLTADHLPKLSYFDLVWGPYKKD